MARMHRILFFLFLHWVFQAMGARVQAQQITHAWENYVSALDGKPVSINVDMGLGDVAPLKEYPFVIITRIGILEPNVQGMPDPGESATLLSLEERLVEELARQNGALFAGRFTQRGVREFYFYAPDTLRFRTALEKAFATFSSYTWLAKAKPDREWDNYFSVLVPSELDKIKIDSRRRIEEIGAAGMRNRSLYILHYFEFPTPEARKKFLMEPMVSGYTVDFLPVERKEENKHFEVVIGKQDKPDFPWIEKTVIPMHAAARSARGKYKGWDYTNK